MDELVGRLARGDTFFFGLFAHKFHCVTYQIDPEEGGSSVVLLANWRNREHPTRVGDEIRATEDAPIVEQAAVVRFA